VAVVFLAQLLVVPDLRWMPSEVETAVTWMRNYNRRAEDPSARLRAMCLSPEPGTFMLFGTNLPREDLARQLGHLPPCRGVEGLLRPVPRGMPGEVELPQALVAVPEGS
jgi:hypothetical protein